MKLDCELSGMSGLEICMSNAKSHTISSIALPKRVTSISGSNQGNLLQGD